MIDKRQWYVLGVAALIIIGLGVWWAVTTRQDFYLLNTGASTSTTTI